jgi:hypothetical protein
MDFNMVEHQEDKWGGVDMDWKGNERNFYQRLKKTKPNGLFRVGKEGLQRHVFYFVQHSKGG